MEIEIPSFFPPRRPAWPWVKWTERGLAPPENTRNVHEYEPSRQQQQRSIVKLQAPDDCLSLLQWCEWQPPLFPVIISNTCDHVTAGFTPPHHHRGETGFCEAEKGRLVSLLYLWCLLWKCGSNCHIVTLYTKTVKRGAVILTNHLFLFRDALRPLFWAIRTNISDLSGYYRYYWIVLWYHIRIGHECIPTFFLFFLFTLHETHYPVFIKQTNITIKKKHATNVKLTKWFFLFPRGYYFSFSWLRSEGFRCTTDV